MSNSVYANGREIACKAGSGKSIAAFPDVCLSPPSPPAGPLPIPYPLTAMDTDTDQGSKKVKVSGKEVMLKSDSNFKKCAGDEAATKSFGSSVITHNITGKVYFCMWSMDVKIEGANAVRHLDMVTHNHMSQVGATPPWTFAERAAMAEGLDDCKGEVDRAKKACTKDGKGKEWKKSAICPSASGITLNENMRDALPSGDKRRKPIQKRVVKAYKRFQEKVEDNACQRAMRCLLVPYEKTVDGEKKNFCCPGQTPHHVIEASSFFEGEAGASPKRKGCEKYSHGKAPCVCAEGDNQNTGTHGYVHTYSGNANLKTMKAAKSAPDIKYKHARRNGAQAVKKSFPDSGCSQECLEAQLDKYHKAKPPDGPGMTDDKEIRGIATGRVKDSDVAELDRKFGHLPP